MRTSRLVLGDSGSPLPQELVGRRDALAAYAGKPIAIGIRPEYTAAPSAGDALRLRGTLLVSEPLGAESLVHLELPIRPVNTEEVREVARDADATVLQELRDAAETARTPFRARFTGSYRGRPGEPVEVAVDARQLYVFDLETGAAIGPEPATRPVAA